MRGRRRGRPTKWLRATVEEAIDVSTTGIRFEVWTKWKKKNKKLGTLIVSVGGLRWSPLNAKKERRRTWDEVDEYFQSS
jgi:hypothetical protein